MATNMYIHFEKPAIGQEEIEVLSWNHGFSQPASPTRGGGSGSVDQATHQNLVFTKYLDRATNELLKYCWSGKDFGRVTLTCYRASGATDQKPVLYLKVVMQHVIISNYAVTGGPGDIPVENVALDYGTVQYEYISQKQDGMFAAVQHDLRSGVVQ
jgi:type VI secretion system secreted protein Hcp